MIDYERIKKDCFWDLDISAADIDKMINGSDMRDKIFLFEKILLNSTKLLLDLNLFERDELRSFLETFRPPEFNHDYAFRRKNIAEVFFFDNPLRIDELKWTA